MKKYFARANTAQGLVNLTENNLKNISNLYIVKGRSKSAKSRLIEQIAAQLADKFAETECIYSPFDTQNIEGLIVRDIKFAIIDGECAENMRDCRKIDTDKFLKTEKLNTDYINELEKLAESAYEKFYGAYEIGKRVHDGWEKIYIDNIDFDRLNSYTDGVIDELIGNKRGKSGADNFERFFGASTPCGSVNYIDNITEKLNRRYFIKGRPGTGKSTFLKKLAKAAQQAGFDTEVYFCAFDKNSLDMTVVPELGFCVFDATAPHELFPSDERDSVLDFYRESGLCGTDEKAEKELELAAAQYRFRMTEGISYLKLGNLYAGEREFYLNRVTDFEETARTADKIIRTLI